MKIHEYQGKELFRKFGMATPRGYPCFSVDEAVEAVKKLGGKVWVVKAQIHAGGREPASKRSGASPGWAFGLNRIRDARSAVAPTDQGMD